jgi:hypothetical protein
MIEIKQINCGKRPTSMTLVTQWKDCEIVFIQEPNQSASSEMKRKGKYYKTQLGRSAILVKTQNLDCTLIPQFSNKDITAVGKNTVYCKKSSVGNASGLFPESLTVPHLHCRP